jgi:spore coat protein U-like protein
MDNGSDTIVYTLYSDSGRSVSVTKGNPFSTLTAFGFVANGSSQNLNLYGKIANIAAQGKVIGNYTDNVTITVDFDAG